MNNGTLYSIDGMQIENIGDLRKASDQLEINETVKVNTSEGVFTVVTTQHPQDAEKGYIGVSIGQTTVVKEEYEEYSPFLIWLTTGISTVALLNFLIGVFNMLPIKPLDGGLIVETLITEFIGEENLSYLHAVSLMGWTLLLGTILLTLTIGSL